MGLKNCKRKDCTLFNNGQCPVCKECNAPMNKVDDSCVRCHNCQYDPGFIRGTHEIVIQIVEDGIVVKEEKIVFTYDFE